MCTLAFLSGSDNRVEILGSLVDDAKKFRELASDIDAPRTTTRDNLAGLVEQGLAGERLDRTYYATTTGERIYQAYHRCREEIAAVERLSPFLDHVAFSNLPDSLEGLRDASVVVPSDADPYRPMMVFADALRDATRIRLFLPTASSLVESALYEDPSRPTKLLVNEATFDQLGTDSPPSWSVRVADDPFDFSIAITDTEVALCCFDDEMIARALVRTDDSDVRQWAISTFHSHWVGIDTHPVYTDRMSWSPPIATR